MNLTNFFKTKLIFCAIISLFIAQKTHTCYLASASSDGTIKIWDILKPSGKEIVKTLKNDGDETEESVLSVSFNPKKPSILASGSYNKTITIWDISKKDGYEFIRILRGHKSPISSLIFHPENNNILISGSHDGIIKIWDLSQKYGNELLSTFKVAMSRIFSTKFNSENNNTLIIKAFTTFPAYKTTKYWNISDQKKPREVKKPKTKYNYIDQTMRYPKNYNISAYSLFKEILINYKNKNIKTLTGHKDNIIKIAFAPAIKNKFIIQDQKERIQFLQDNSENLEIKKLAINLGNWKKLKANNILF